jgi:Rhodopirellula transposase DDE domain
MLAYLRGTQTTTGLEVQAFLQEGTYATGGTVSDAEMETLNLERHAVCPNWNYTLRPHSGGQSAAVTDPAKREVVS